MRLEGEVVTLNRVFKHLVYARGEEYGAGEGDQSIS
jgi:hypothetical protein